MRPRNLTTLTIDLADADLYGFDVAAGIAYTKFRQNINPKWRPSRDKLTRDIGLSQVAAQRATDFILNRPLTPKKRRAKNDAIRCKPNDQNRCKLNEKTVENSTDVSNVSNIERDSIDSIYLGGLKSNEKTGQNDMSETPPCGAKNEYWIDRFNRSPVTNKAIRYMDDGFEFYTYDPGEIPAGAEIVGLDMESEDYLDSV